MSADELLAGLEKNIDSLLKERDALQKEVAILRDANDRQRQEMIRTHEELAVLKREYDRLRLAHAMTADSPEREIAKRQITRMIHTIDKIMIQLKSETTDDGQTEHNA